MTSANVEVVVWGSCGTSMDAGSYTSGCFEGYAEEEGDGRQM
jgi:hypothetical protein